MVLSYKEKRKRSHTLLSPEHQRRKDEKPFSLKGHGHCPLEQEVGLLAGTSRACEQDLEPEFEKWATKSFYRVWENRPFLWQHMKIKSFLSQFPRRVGIHRMPRHSSG